MDRTVGCFSNCFGAASVFAAVERLGTTGLDHLELALRGHNFGGLVIPESSVITVDSPESRIHEFLQKLSDCAVKISGCNIGGANILTPDGLELTQRRMQFAKRWFGVGIVVSGAGQPTNDAEHAIMIESLRSLGKTAEELGLTVALETHKGPTQNADAMLTLIEQVDHPRIRLNFDTGNIAYYNRLMKPEGELEKVKDLVKNVHLKDNRGGFEDWFFPAVGDGGAVNFETIRAILDGVGFLGPYTIEIEGIQNEPEPGLDGRVDRVFRSAHHLVACGYFREV